jgi:signal peptidase II
MQKKNGREQAPSSWVKNLEALYLLVMLFARVDLFTKQLVFRIPEGVSIGQFLSSHPEKRLLGNFLYLQLSANQGGAFGIGQGKTGFFILVPLLMVAVMLYVYCAFGRKHLLPTLAICLILGGAIGNLFDRIRFGFVRDFIRIRVGKFAWPNFNAADVWICIGAALLLLWSMKRPEPAPAPPAKSPAGRA